MALLLYGGFAGSPLPALQKRAFFLPLLACCLLACRPLLAWRGSRYLPAGCLSAARHPLPTTPHNKFASTCNYLSEPCHKYSFGSQALAKLYPRSRSILFPNLTNGSLSSQSPRLNPDFMENFLESIETLINGDINSDHHEQSACTAYCCVFVWLA